MADATQTYKCKWCYDQGFILSLSNGSNTLAAGESAEICFGGFCPANCEAAEELRLKDTQEAPDA